MTFQQHNNDARNFPQWFGLLIQQAERADSLGMAGGLG